MTDQTLTPPEHRVDATVNVTGHGTFILDGEDISDHLAGFEVRAVAGQATEVMLHLGAQGRFGVLPDRISGLARVYVATDDPGPAAAQFLAAIDPEALETAALNRHDLGGGPHDLTRAMLVTLIEWAEGRG